MFGVVRDRGLGRGIVGGCEDAEAVVELFGAEGRHEGDERLDVAEGQLERVRHRVELRLAGIDVALVNG